VQTEFPVLLLGDAFRIRQILTNLLDNAVKFTEQGEVVLQLGYQEGVLSLDVRDTGIGIPAQAHQRIFESFSQVEATAGRRYGGSGLGLSICRQLAVRMGGTIVFESEAGKGSRFTVRLPLSVAAEKAAAGAPKVLAVDDDAVGRQLVQTILRGGGYQVQVVDSGQAAVEAVEQARYDLILMDLRLPGMDGLETTRRIRALEQPGAHVPILALTAHALAEERDRCFGAGMDDFVTKPIEAESLIGVVRRWVG
jgi:CheY-like chemotaxis protein/anti-sigma regulatory factor (Ser/Thr protein kinase)